MVNTKQSRSFGYFPVLLAIAFATFIGIVGSYSLSGVWQGAVNLAVDDTLVDVNKLERFLKSHPAALPAKIKAHPSVGTLAFTWYQDKTTPTTYNIKMNPSICQRVARKLELSTDSTGFKCLPKPDSSGHYWAQVRERQDTA